MKPKASAMRKKYPSKVSYGLLIFMFLVLYGPLIPVLIHEEFNGKVIGLIGFLTLVFAFILHLFFGTHYTIEQEVLKIKCGFFSYEPIAIMDIKELAASRNWMASPAPSLDRIAITYGTFNEVLISPKDLSLFVADLTAINPKIRNKITN